MHKGGREKGRQRSSHFKVTSFIQILLLKKIIAIKQKCESKNTKMGLETKVIEKRIMDCPSECDYQGPDMLLQFLSGGQTISKENALEFYHREKSNYGLPQIHKFVKYFDL